MPGRLAVVAAVLLWSGCSYISFQKPPTVDELALEGEVREFYDEMSQAFASANPEALTSLYASTLAHPMTQDQVRAWARKFFADNGPAHLKLKKVEFDELSYIRAVVMVDYAVETKGARGDFSGVERDVLERHQGRWFIASWDKVR